MVIKTFWYGLCSECVGLRRIQLKSVGTLLRCIQRILWVPLLDYDMLSWYWRDIWRKNLNLTTVHLFTFGHAKLFCEILGPLEHLFVSSKGEDFTVLSSLLALMIYESCLTVAVIMLLNVRVANAACFDFLMRDLEIQSLDSNVLGLRKQWPGSIVLAKGVLGITWETIQDGPKSTVMASASDLIYWKVRILLDQSRAERYGMKYAVVDGFQVGATGRSCFASSSWISRWYDSKGSVLAGRWCAK